MTHDPAALVPDSLAPAAEPPAPGDHGRVTGPTAADEVDVLPVPRAWAGHRTYGGRALLAPRTLEALARLVTSGEPVRAVGSRHSFNDLVDSDGALVTLTHLEREPVLAVAPDGAATVTVSAGTTYGRLGPWLHERGYALAALASLPHISVVGAVTTATHGSGDAIRTLAGAVVGLELLTAQGDVRALHRGDPDFAGAVVALGGLGLVLTVTLAVEPTYEVAQTVRDDVALDGVLAHLDAVFAGATSVSVFTRWDGRAAVWRKQRTDAGPGAAARDLGDRTSLDDLSGLGGRDADGPRHPLPDGDPVACTPQLGEPGPWFARLPHFRLEFTPSAGAELQSEYLLPREAAADAIRAAAPVLAEARDLVLVSELRSMAADDLWLSGAYGRDTVGLHTTWRQDSRVPGVLPRLEEALAPYAPRPHWGKLFADPDPAGLAAHYPRWADQVDLFLRYDPDGVFAGPLLRRVGLRA